MTSGPLPHMLYTLESMESKKNLSTTHSLSPFIFNSDCRLRKKEKPFALDLLILNWEQAPRPQLTALYTIQGQHGCCCWSLWWGSQQHPFYVHGTSHNLVQCSALGDSGHLVAPWWQFVPIMEKRAPGISLWHPLISCPLTPVSDTPLFHVP